MQASLALRMCARTRSPIVGFFSRAPLSRVGLPHFRIPGNIAAWVTLLLRSRPGTELVRCTQWSDGMESLAFGRARSGNEEVGFWYVRYLGLFYLSAHGRGCVETRLLSAK